MHIQSTIIPQSKITAATDSEKSNSIAFNQQLFSTKNLNHLPIQRKLSIGTVDDPLEREADETADKIMRMPESSFIQRKCAECEEEEKLQRKPLGPFIQRKTSKDSGITSDAVTNRIESTKEKGDSLPESYKSFMESRFATNLSDVRIHTNDHAIQLSRELNAQAFTVGNDIYFNSGKYSPESNDGKHLLAHELTHVLQQNSTLQRNRIQKKVVDDTAHVTCRTTRADSVNTLTTAEADAISLAQRAAMEIRFRLDFHSLIPIIGETPGLHRFRDILWRRFRLDYNLANVRNTLLPIIARRYELVANWIGRLNHRYICGAPGTEPPGACTTSSAGNAWTATGINRTQLCDGFWTRSADDLAETILHEWFHFGFDWLGDCEQRLNINNTKCYDMFAAELAGTATASDYDTCCAPPADPLPALMGGP